MNPKPEKKIRAYCREGIHNLCPEYRCECECHLPTPPPAEPIQDWEKGFDRLFLSGFDKYGEGWEIYDPKGFGAELKSFIRTLLHQALEAEVKGIRKQIYGHCFEKGYKTFY